MKVYLINKQDRYCPENNNGDYIVAAFLDIDLAKEYCEKQDKFWPLWEHNIYIQKIIEKTRNCLECNKELKNKGLFCSTDCFFTQEGYLNED